MIRTLVTTADVATHSEWRIFDCRHDLGDVDKGARAYAAGHVPGALHAHLDADLSAAKTGRNGRHPLPSADAFAAWLGARGVRSDDVVIAYDDGAGAYAARLWWMLRWLGHAQVAVLNGGFAAWVREGRPVATELPTFAPATYLPRVKESERVDTAAVLQNLERGAFQVLDARGANRFAGRDETMDPVAGHIPGAINRPFTENVTADGTFKPPAELRREFDALLDGRPSAQIVHQCGSGVTATHNLLAMEIAGLDGSRLYPGSWSEWCSDPSRPVASDG